MDTSAIVSVERVEREAWLDLFSIAAPEVINSLGIRWTHLPAATVFAAREAPLVEFNRALGLGLEQPVTEEDLEAVTAWLRAHGNSASALQLAPLVLSEVVLDWMHKTDLEAAGAGWTKFWRGTSPVPDHPSQATLVLRLAEPSDAADFGAVVQAGFGAPPPFATWFSGLVGRPKWRIYLAYNGKDPVATGALFIDRGWAWIGVAATLPGYRGRGAQTALLSRRISDGLAAGVAGFTGETSEAVPGQQATQTSYRNLLRAGFSVAYTRVNYRVTKGLL
jgi:hypothetical protein